MHIHPSLYLLLQEGLRQEASDLHVMAGLPPSVRLDGDIEFLAYDPLTPDDLRKMLLGLLSDAQAEKLERQRDLNFSIFVQGLSRFRVSLYYQRGHLEASIRIIPPQTRSLEELGLPPVVRELALRTAGLVLVTGSTGSGKTTCLNAMIDLINSERRSRIITIEDPIEYIHPNKRSVVIQRELESDTPSFDKALVAALRQDPNVICVGEMRHMDTMLTALQAAETGHLVLTTLHTQGAAQAIDRIIDVFPPGQQDQVRMQLAGSLQGIISLQLLPRLGEKGRVLAREVLVATTGVRNLIRTGKTEQLLNSMLMGSGDGMNCMDRHLRSLYEQGDISFDTALSHAHNPAEFRSLRSDN